MRSCKTEVIVVTRNRGKTEPNPISDFFSRIQNCRPTQPPFTFQAPDPMPTFKTQDSKHLAPRPADLFGLTVTLRSLKSYYLTDSCNTQSHPSIRNYCTNPRRAVASLSYMIVVLSRFQAAPRELKGCNYWINISLPTTIWARV